MALKKCNKCGITKHSTEFDKENGNKFKNNGFKPWFVLKAFCKKCMINNNNPSGGSHVSEEIFGIERVEGKARKGFIQL